MGGSFKFVWVVEPMLAYRYMALGAEYTGHDIGPTEINTASKRNAENKIEPYPVGKDVTVYYNPSKPEEAVLQKQSGATAYLLFGAFGVILFSVGLLALFGLIPLNS